MISTQVLLAFPFFGAMSASSRALLGTAAGVRSYRRGARLIGKGDRVGGMYFVLAGALRVFSLSAAGAEASLYRVRAGESCLLAMNALFAEMRYPAWVVVESREARVLCVPGAVYKQLHETESEVRAFTLRVLAERVFDLMGALEEISLHPLDERLRSFLLRRANARWEVDATHEEIAVYLATAREVVSRKLERLAETGVVRTRRRRIEILKPHALH